MKMFLITLLFAFTATAQVTTSDSIQIGKPGSSANKEIKAGAGRGSKPAIRYNTANTKWEFSNDATIFKALGSGSGSGAGINLLTNPGFEDGITSNWVTSGTALVAVTSGVNLLFDQITASWTPTATGHFFESTPIVVPNGLYGAACMVEVWYQGADANAYLTVFTASAEYIPSTARATLNATAGIKKAKVYFDCPSSGSLKLRVQSTAAMAVGYFDKAHLGQSDSQGASNLITATPYIPTIVGFGSVTSVQAYWARQADMIEVWGGFTTGGPTATQASISLPNGLNLDVNKVLNIQRTYLGHLSRAANGATNSTPGAAAGPYTLISETGSSTSAVFISAATNTTAPHYVVALGNAIANSGDQIQFKFRVPIAGWGLVENSINSKCVNDIACENTFSASVNSSGVVSGENLDWLNGNCTFISSGYSCPFISGIFTATPTCWGSSTEAGGATTARVLTIDTASSSSGQVRYTMHQSGAGNVASAAIITCQKNVDFKAKQNIQGFLSSTVTSGQNNLRIEAALVDSICSTSPCTMAQTTGGFSSITRLGLGQYQANFQAGTFSYLISCMATAHTANGNPTYIASDSSGLTATSFKFRTIRRDTHLEFDEKFSLTCIGVR